MQNEEIIICLTGGATGGHLFPLITVKKEIDRFLKEKNLKVSFVYVGVKPIDRSVLEKEGIRVVVVPSAKIRKYFSFKNIIDFIKIPFNIIFSFYHLFLIMPDVLFSKGGPGSLGVVFAAWVLRIPILIHDSDSIPGFTNRLSSFLANKIAISFLSAQKFFPPRKTIFTGHPVDTSILTMPIYSQDYERFGLREDKKIILILGGSQGSEFLNNLVIESLEDLLFLGQVVHQTGEKHYNQVFVYAKESLSFSFLDKMKNYHPFPFISHDDLIFLLKMSDVVISRAGAGSIFEIALLGKPSILIPLDPKIAGDHQVKNAYQYFDHGACYVLEEKNATPSLLLTLVREIINKPEISEKMHNGALSFAKIDAAPKLAQELINLLPE